MFGFIGNIGAWELVLVLLIALIVFGPGKLPEVAKGLGKAVNQFKNASSGLQKEFQDAIKESEPAPSKTESVGSPPIVKAEDDQSNLPKEGEDESKSK